jgi:hypothetical protein
MIVVGLNVNVNLVVAILKTKTIILIKKRLSMSDLNNIEREFNMYSAAHINNFELISILDCDHYDIVKMKLNELAIIVEHLFEKYGKKTFKQFYKIIKNKYLVQQINFEHYPDTLINCYLEHKVDKNFHIKIAMSQASMIFLMKHTIKDKSFFSSSRGLKNLILYGTLFRINKDFRKFCFASESMHELNFETFGNKIL